MEFFTNPWLIGIGTAVIAGLILHFGFGIGKPKPKDSQIATTIQEKNHSTPLPQPLDSISNDITPSKITNYLRTLPPVQQESAAAHYKGIKVSWKLNLQHTHTISGVKLHLMMLNNGKYPWVYCDVDPNEYPILRVIKKNQLFTVQGEIESVSSGTIILKNCQLFF
jgi:hypothetical protein